MQRVRDRLWLWCHPIGSHNEFYKIGGESKISPADAARYLGLSNAIMVRWEGKPAPPYHDETMSLVGMDQVVWSIVGAGGTTEDDELNHVLDLSQSFANLSGAIMDDFFRIDINGRLMGDEVAIFKPEQLAGFRSRLNQSALDLWVVIYTHQLDAPVSEHLDQCDVVTLWTWKSCDIPSIEENLQRLEAMSKSPRKVLGCYMFDYGEQHPMSVEHMEYQCNLGLKWLKDGRIDGMIFLASCICDLDLEAVEWTRQWIAEVGSDVIAESG